MSILRSTLFLALATFSFVARAQDADGAALAGQVVNGRTYVSPTGAYRVTIPVLAELGGNITDTPVVVSFQDNYNTYVNIAAIEQDATQRWELSTRGIKDYLIYFFSNSVLSEFKQAYPGAQSESAKFLPGMLDGSLIASILLPGGSMFADKTPTFLPNQTPPVAKRGYLLFVKYGHVYVISVELAERVTEGRSYKATPAEEDEVLRQRLTDVVLKIQFVKPPAADAAAK